LTTPTRSSHDASRGFTRRQRLGLFLLARASALGLRAVASTCSLEIRNGDHFKEATREGGGLLLAFWHEVLCLAAWHLRHRGTHTLTSYSYDGELAARTVRLLGIDALRGSSTEGGMEALSALRAALAHTQVTGLTVDGPKGPRRQVKPGVVILSHQARIPILPVAYVAKPAWRLRSWDRLLIPRPFGRIVAEFGAPLFPPEGRLRDVAESYRLELEEALSELQARLDREAGFEG